MQRGKLKESSKFNSFDIVKQFILHAFWSDVLFLAITKS